MTGRLTHVDQYQSQYADTILHTKAAVHHLDDDLIQVPSIVFIKLNTFYDVEM